MWINGVIYTTGFLMLYVVQFSSSWSLFPVTDTFSSTDAISLRNMSRAKRQSTCGDEEFKCTSGQCIPLDQECDGAVNCADKSDESSLCGRIKCPSIFFTCNYGACINKAFECDGKQDCRDNSDEQSPRCKRSTSSCGDGKFQCASGQCISDTDECDGTKNCDDGSDETAEKCADLACPDIFHRCAYGACVNGNARCNNIVDCADGSDEEGCPNQVTRPRPPIVTPSPPIVSAGGCILPQHPPNGQFEILGEQSQYVYVPNTAITQFVFILLKCRPGYISKTANLSACYSGAWSPPQSECVRTCQTLEPTDTYDVKCIYQNNDVSCETPKEGTRLEITCKDYFKYSGVRPVIRCRDGSWDYVISPCVPECGKKIVGVQTLIIGGSSALKGEYPWATGIYYSSDREHLCGGSIISRYYVLSAAHCFTFERGKRKGANEFLVAAGKYYRALDDERDKNKQIREIKTIHIPEFYKGITQNYNSDLAILELKQPFQLSHEVQLVCIDSTRIDETKYFTDGKLAVVAGWGHTKVSTTSPSETLKKLLVPFRSRETCIKFLPDEFSDRYYTADKICAGYIENRTSVCGGDSGGGLFFKDDIEKTYYVRGIVSLAPNLQSGGCNPNQFSLYTKISEHLTYIFNVTGWRM